MDRLQLPTRAAEAGDLTLVHCPRAHLSEPLHLQPFTPALVQDPSWPQTEDVFVNFP